MMILTFRKLLLCNQFDCYVCMPPSLQSVCAVLPVWWQNSRLQSLCTDSFCVLESWQYQTSSLLSPRWLCVRPASSTSEEPWEYNLVKDYFGGTCHAELKPQRLPFTDAGHNEAWTSRNSPGSYLWSLSTETRIRTLIVSWSLAWRQCFKSNHQESILKEFLLRHGSGESN